MTATLPIEGRARRFADDVNTDYIISSRRKRESIDGHVLKAFIFEAVDPGFAASVRPGDVIVAGRNFGCGSAMEAAATVLIAAGFRAVLAETFSRSFYRNAINNGLLPVECDTRAIEEADRVLVRVSDGALEVANVTRATSVSAAALPAIMREIFEAGGIAPYVRAGRGRFA